MTDKPKTIQEALAEVQRKINEQRQARAAAMAEDYLEERARMFNAAGRYLGISKPKPRTTTSSTSASPSSSSATSPAPSASAPAAAAPAPAATSQTPFQAGRTGGPAPTGQGTTIQPGQKYPNPTPAPAGQTAQYKAGQVVGAAEKNKGAIAATVAAGGAGYVAGKSGSSSPTAAAAPKAETPKAETPKAAPSITTTSGSGKEYGPGNKFKGTIKDFQKQNPGATVGQAMNAIQGKTAITGGKNDPTVIAGERSKGVSTGPVQPVYTPKGGTNMQKGEVAGKVASRNTEPGYSGNAGAELMAATSKPAVSAAPAKAPETPKADTPKAEPETRRTPSTMDGFDQESGGKKKKLKESALIDAFFKLHNMNSGNIFEAAKKLTKKQDEKLDVVDDDKIDEKDFAALRAKKKMHEAAKPDYVDLDKDGDKKEPMKKAAKEAKKHHKMDEEVQFSEEEIAHLESVLARKDKTEYDNTLTDETEEGAVKRGRGRPAGSKSNKEGMTEPMRVAAQVRNARPYHNDAGKEVHDLKHPTTGKTYQVGTKAVNDFNRDYASAGKPEHKDSVEAAFIKKHMSG